MNVKRLLFCVFVLFFAAVPSLAINAPTSFNAVADPGEKVALSWNGVSGAAGYNVYRKEQGDKEFKKIASAIRSTNYDDRKARQGKSYEYYVVALDARSAESGKSNISSAPHMIMSTDGSIFHIDGGITTIKSVKTNKPVTVAVPGDIISYIIRIGNNGYGSAKDAIVTFPVPVGTRLIRNSVNPGKFNIEVSYFDRENGKWTSRLEDEGVVSKIRFKILKAISPRAKGYDGEISFKVIIET